MLLLLNLGLALLTIVHGQSQFHLVPGIVPVEHNIESGQTLSNLEELRNAIGIPNPFTLKVDYSREASNGLERQRLSIWYDGVMVRVVKLQASMDNGHYTGAVSGYFPANFPSTLDVSCERSDAELRAALVDYINTMDNVPSFINNGVITESVLEDFEAEKQIAIESDGTPVLVYFVRATIDIPDQSGAYIRFPRGIIRHVDLFPVNINLVVLKDSSRTACPRSRGGNIAYPGNVFGAGPDKKCLNAKKTGKTCEFSNDDVVVYTVNNAWDRHTAEVMSFKCKKGPGDEANGAFSPSSDAFHSAQVFFSMMKKWGKLDSPRSDPIKLYVHFGDRYPNSFYDGHDLTFGDGTYMTYSVAIPEVLGHEMCHLYTDVFGNLQVNKESIALNEAFSDMCGKAVTLYDTGVNDWLFAKEFERDFEALRYFENPTRDGFSIDHMNDFDESLSEYSLMGVYLKFMYNLVEMEHIDYMDAFEAMVFANQVYWNEESSMIDGACGIMRAAMDLSLNAHSFYNAFESVGINLDFCSLQGTVDIISSLSCSGSVIRRPTVSASKTPMYVIRAANGASNVHVRVQHAGASDVKVISVIDGQSYDYEELNVNIAMGSDEIMVGLTSTVETKIDVEFSFS